MVPNLSTTVNEVKVTLSNYNIASYGEGEMKVSSVVFTGDKQMISVKSFKNKDDGMLYIQNLGQYPEFKSSVTSNKYDTFIISMENFAYFYQQKNVKDYLTFYGDYYIGK